jgi:adenylate cyclase
MRHGSSLERWSQRTTADIVAWLLREGRHLPSLPDLLRALGARLVAAGVPVWRLHVGLHQLHPAFFGRAIVWDRTKDTVVEKPRPHGIEDSAYYRNNPVSAIFERGAHIRRKLEGAGAVLDYPVLRQLQGDGGTDYAAFPLEFYGRRNQAIAFTSNHPGGFRSVEISILEDILPAVGAAVEILHDRDEMQRLLATYVGARAGDRILNGSIKRGDCETIDAVLWICDLENFTAVSETLSGRDLITLLDSYFDAVVSPIERHGGEVLKFMGDSVLAIFPLSDCADQAVVHRDALAAAREGIAAVQALNETWLARTHRPIGCGVALHVGKVSYGNIGAADRLDFTVIGPAVNLAARLEQLTRRVGTRLVLSEDFARALAETVVPLGEFALKGISKGELVFGLPQPVGKSLPPTRRYPSVAAGPRIESDSPEAP